MVNLWLSGAGGAGVIAGYYFLGVGSWITIVGGIFIIGGVAVILWGLFSDGSWQGSPRGK